MKNHHIHLLLALPLLIAACSQDDEQQMQPAQAEVSLSVSAAIEGTRAPIERTVFLKDESISTCLMQGDSTLLSWRDFRFDGSTWTAVQPARLQPWQGSAVAYAVYPALADSVKASTSYTRVPVRIATADGDQQEYLYSAAEVTAQSREARFTFHFALTRVTFVISKSQIYAQTGTRLYLTQAALKNRWKEGGRCLNTVGMLDLSTGNIDVIKPYSEKEVETTIALPQDSVEITTGQTVKVDFLLIPTKLGSDVSLELTINDKQFSLPLPEGTAWEKGRQYTYPVTLDYNF